MIVWILLGFMLGLAASKIVSTTGEGTVVDILLGIVGALTGGWQPSRFTSGSSPIGQSLHRFLRLAGDSRYSGRESGLANRGLGVISSSNAGCWS